MSVSVVRAGGSVIAETPIGAIQGYAGTAAPTGWLLCDGTAVSRSTYSELFGVVSTTYGSGDGSTTFNLPNITGYIIYATRLSTRVTLNNPPEFVTALPSSPLDGKEIYYQADGTNGVIWHLRYRSGSSSSYKWEFVGGPALWNDVDTAQTTSSDSYTDLSTAGPTVTTPLAGDYLCSFTSFMVWGYVTIKVGSAAAGDTNMVQRSNVTSGYEAGGGSIVLTGVAASTALKVQYKRLNSTSSTGEWANRRLRVIPIRVG